MHELSTDHRPATTSLTWPLEVRPWNPSGVQGLGATVAPDSLLGACNKCRTFLHHTLIGLNCVWASGPKFALATKPDLEGVSDFIHMIFKSKQNLSEMTEICAVIICRRGWWEGRESAEMPQGSVRDLHSRQTFTHSLSYKLKISRWYFSKRIQKLKT